LLSGRCRAVVDEVVVWSGASTGAKEASKAAESAKADEEERSIMISTMRLLVV
jgi:hypothetical protein